jgi:DNA-binding transcriptional LysR family regulator
LLVEGRRVLEQAERARRAVIGMEVVLDTCPSPEIIDGGRDRGRGLRVTALGDESVVVVLAESQPAAGASAISPQKLDRTPLLMMARTTNPAFFDAAMSAWRDAGIAATPLEVAEPRLEHPLLAVAAGAGMATSAFLQMARAVSTPVRKVELTVAG